MNPARARHGDAPAWVLRPVLLTFLGLPVLVATYAVAATALRWNAAPSPAPFVSVAVVAVVLHLAAAGHARRPLTAVDRTYYRLALLVIGLFGLMGTFAAGAVVGAGALLHSLAADRHPASTGPVDDGSAASESSHRDR